MGPVQEKETKVKVKAIKKIPINPPRSEALSALLTNQLGSTISKAPKNENAKIRKTIKNVILKKTLLAISLSASLPKVTVTKNPSPT